MMFWFPLEVIKSKTCGFHSFLALSHSTRPGLVILIPPYNEQTMAEGFLFKNSGRKRSELVPLLSLKGLKILSSFRLVRSAGPLVSVTVITFITSLPSPLGFWQLGLPPADWAAECMMQISFSDFDKNFNETCRGRAVVVCAIIQISDWFSEILKTVRHVR